MRVQPGYLVLAAGLLLLGLAPAGAQHNPRGWIQTSAWNLLWPLRQDGGCRAGGPENMLRNWVAPHDLGTEDPRAGDVWDDIDFGGAAASPGFGGDPGLGPTWFTLESLAARFPGTAWPSGALVSLQELSDYWNSRNDPGEQLVGLADLASDNVLALATTYLRNTTGGDLPVEICASGDDSIQVWLNDCRVINFSHCAPEHECDGFATVILPPGDSKVSVLVWEGGGGWSFRLAVRDASGIRYDDASAEVDFLGPGPSAVTPPDTCCEANADGVRITGGSSAGVGEEIVLAAVFTGAEGPASYSWSVTPEGAVSLDDHGDGTAGVRCFEAAEVIVTVAANDGLCAGATDMHYLECVIRERSRIGDENGDALLNIADPVALLNHLFSARNPTLPCGDGTVADPANRALLDVNGTNTIDIADAVHVLNFLFSGGPGPWQCQANPCCVVIPGCPDSPCFES